jgi:hypothetical protein
MATAIPEGLEMPDRIETRLGTLRFTDGFPDDATVAVLRDNLDFQRAVQAYLAVLPAASLAAQRRGFRAFGADNGTVLLFDSLLDARSLFLTLNTETVYAFAWLGTRGGPVVLECPPAMLGMVNDVWGRYVADIGVGGPDQGRGGEYLLLPPGYDGHVPDGFHVVRSPTYNNLCFLRGFLVDGDPAPAAATIRGRLRIYPLSEAARPRPTHIVDVSGVPFSTIAPQDASCFELVHELIEEEPADAIDAETLGLLASLGIAKGHRFAPDERLRAILAEAALVGAATARANAYRTRLEAAFLYPGSAWCTPFVGGSHEFLQDHARLLDARSFMYFHAFGVSPSMTVRHVGAGSVLAAAFVDATGRPLDGGRRYRLHLPPDIPARQFWSLVLYDTQTRSMLQTDQRFPSTGSQRAGLHVSGDGSVDIEFGPAAPEGGESANWLQTMPQKGWSTILRLYGPLQAFFDGSWRPGEIEPVDEA